VPGDMRFRHSEMTWVQIAGMHNRIIHACDAMDLDALWKTVTHDLPTVVTAFEAILRP
jgi:uncharacterized protein with HEPN domain